MPKLSFNILLSLIISSKKLGKGRLGNGRILVKLLTASSDCKNSSQTREWSVLSKFSNEIVKPNAYHKIDKLIGRFLPDGKYYPYDKITFNDLENSFENPEKYHSFLGNMSNACDEILDPSKVTSLVYTLLEIIRHDSCISKIFYDGEWVDKQDFFGSFAHPKRICIEALLLWSIYHTHTNPSEENLTEYSLITPSEGQKFHVARYRNEDSLKLDFQLNLADSLRENARYDFNLLPGLYPIEFRCNGKKISALPVGKNIFLYGQGGIGKTTFMLDIAKNSDDETVYFYIPLNQYKHEIHEKFMPESCNILVSILLKYHYQFEYQTYESAAACEGEESILKQLTELLQLLEVNNIDFTPQYALLLDGLNEIPSAFQENLVNELKRICADWKNVHLIVSGRTVPQYDLFREFQTVEILGIPENAQKIALSGLPDYETIIQNNRLTELFKSPMFLNIYLQSRDNNNFDSELNTRGELLDYYIKSYEASFSELSDIDRKTVGFIIRYALPLAAKIMLDRHGFEIDRADLSEAVDKAYDTFIMDERVYQNYIAPQKYRKAELTEIREKTDFTEFIVDNICFLTTDNSAPQKLRFTHQYFRDYFAARHILNLIEAFEVAYKNSYADEQEKAFNKYNLGFVWFDDEEDEIYRLIGEIAGDYQNDDSSGLTTVLDRLLDMSRRFDTFRLTENVIRAMSAVRNGVISDVDFSGTSLPFEIPASIKFVDCDFSNCKVFLLEACEKYPEYTGCFKDCDFSNAVFLIEEYREILRDMGAII